MAKYIIEGGNKLRGKIELSGNKNSILPCIAACLLTSDEVTLRNVPKINDVGVCLEILQSLGAEVETGEHLLKIKCANLHNSTLPEDLVSKLRASILFVGPLLTRVGKVEFHHPGGDVIGKRSIETHLNAFRALGYKFVNHDHSYKGSKNRFLKSPEEIFLNEASVTATENLILATVLGSSEIELKNCTEEPHVVDLCNLLINMGAKIEGVGTSNLKIKGVKKLTGTDFTIRSDHIEFGTYAVAAAISGGEIEIATSFLSDLQSIIYPLQEMGVKFQKNPRSLTVTGGSLKAISKLVVNIWPGFPVDLMSVVIVLATQSKGVSLMHDWMYESRMFFTDKLISMGSNITIADPHRVLVYGPTKLYGRNLETPDIRAGMALVLAALIAQGKSVIDRVELIERGYEDIVAKLSSLGASIQRID